MNRWFNFLLDYTYDEKLRSVWFQHLCISQISIFWRLDTCYLKFPRVLILKMESSYFESFELISIRYFTSRMALGVYQIFLIKFQTACNSNDSKFDLKNSLQEFEQLVFQVRFHKAFDKSLLSILLYCLNYSYLFEGFLYWNFYSSMNSTFYLTKLVILTW